MSDQQRLWQDSIEEALVAVVNALGGPKAVAGRMWPTKSETDPQGAGKALSRCLNPESKEKLGLDEMVWILKAGAAAGVHTGMHYLNQTCGYETPKPVNPETERDKLMREHIEHVRKMESLLRRWEAVNASGVRS